MFAYIFITRSNLKHHLQKSSGRTECKFEFYCSPHLKENLVDDEKRLTLKSSLIYQHKPNSTKFNAVVALKRPINNIDVGAQLFYDVTRHDVNAMISARYAKEKDITATIFWYHPRQALEYMEGRLNVTIPSFKPLILHGKLKEKRKDDYIVSFHINYFSVI